MELYGYFYILREREFIRLNEQTYKIGQTRFLHKRFQNYPKQSCIYLNLAVANCVDFEREVMKLFRNKYQNRTEYGREYFNGNVDEMINDVFHMRNIHRGLCFVEEMDENITSDKPLQETIDHQIDNNTLENIMTTHFSKGNASDRVWKNDVKDLLRFELNDDKLEWLYVLSELKKFGYTYKRQLRVKPRNNDITEKGAILGLKWKS